jgi:hypothetical protein
LDVDEYVVIDFYKSEKEAMLAVMDGKRPANIQMRNQRNGEDS